MPCAASSPSQSDGSHHLNARRCRRGARPQVHRLSPVGSHDCSWSRDTPTRQRCSQPQTHQAADQRLLTDSRTLQDGHPSLPAGTAQHRGRRHRRRGGGQGPDCLPAPVQSPAAPPTITGSGCRRSGHVLRAGCGEGGAPGCLRRPRASLAGRFTAGVISDRTRCRGRGAAKSGVPRGRCRGWRTPRRRRRCSGVEAVMSCRRQARRGWPRRPLSSSGASPEFGTTPHKFLPAVGSVTRRTHTVPARTTAAGAETSYAPARWPCHLAALT